ncbi:MAG: hypothetical protein HDQ93_05355 [Desulfovibrio sp.]|nr:hypothetical protein [Desulfovibrio sp.]
MNYPKAFVIANMFTQKWEKGYVNHPNDPGGATYNGVSLRFLKQTGTDINGDGVIDARDILELYRKKDQAKVDEIFYKAFWQDQKLDQYPCLSLQIGLYDTGVNTGRTQTAKFLQRACNAVSPSAKLDVDGIIGKRSLAATLELIHYGRGMELSKIFVIKRQDFHDTLVNNSPYRDGRDYRPFAKGWRNRVNDLKTYIGLQK